MTDDAPLPLGAGPATMQEALPPSRPFSKVKPPSTAPLFFAALGNARRWEMVKMLADGRALTATDVATAMKRDFDGISKHLRILRRAGVVRSQRGQDRRVELFYIPAGNRPESGVLQWGIVRLDLREQ